MKILHLLNIADLFFIGAGLAAAAMMMIAGDSSGRRKEREPVERERGRLR